MSVTTILFKKGATVPTGSNFSTTVGEPLWYTGGNQLYVTNGTNNPTLIGPIQQAQADWAQNDSTAVDFIKNKPTITAPVQSNWNESDSTSLSYILNKPTIPDAVTYTAVGTSASGVYTMGTLTIGSTDYTLSCPTVSWTQIVNSGTQIATIQIGSGAAIPVYAPNAGESSGRDDELTAVASANQGEADLKTAAGNRLVTLRHDPQNNGVGSMATFAVTDNNSDKFVTMSITVIDGGSW